jgi:hypothetical protein
LSVFTTSANSTKNELDRRIVGEEFPFNGTSSRNIELEMHGICQTNAISRKVKSHYLEHHFTAIHKTFLSLIL